MHRIGFLAIATLLLAPAALAESPSWSLISFAVQPHKAAAVVKAADKLMNSEVGQQFPGKLLLQVHVADGTNKATHSFAPIYESTAQREAFVQKLIADPAWAKFQKVMAKKSRPVSQVLYRTVKGWGEIVDTDHVWMAHAFNVSDPPAFLAAIEKLMASSTGKKFPGQVYLSEVVAGGISPATHVISVGYESEAEMDAWQEKSRTTSNWQRYIRESRKAAEYLGANLARDIKSWGPATLSGITN